MQDPASELRRIALEGLFSEVRTGTALVASCSKAERSKPATPERQKGEREAMHKMRRASVPEQRAPERPPFGNQVAFARLATALALTGLGAVAIGALAIRALVVKRGRIQRLDQEQPPRQGA